MRDILSMGARPVAVMDPLRFGPADAADTRRVLPGVVAGVGGYGNCLGLPNIGGEVVFDASYAGNPLVNALCVGVLRHEDIQLATRPGRGNLVVLFGAHDRRRRHRRRLGAGVARPSTTRARRSGPACRSATRSWRRCSSSAASSSSPPTSSSASRTSAAPGCPARRPSWRPTATAACTCGSTACRCATPSLRPEEILMSESQERMLRGRRAGQARRVPRDLREVGRRSPPSSARSTDTGRLTDQWHGETIVDVPPRTVAHEGPVYERPFARPSWQDALQADGPASLPRPASGDELRDTVLRMVAAPNLASKSWVTDQYDRYVLGNTVLAQPEDAGVVRRRRASRPRRRARDRRQRPVTPGSTRTPVRSSRWPRPTATSPSPVRRRSPSPTA